MSDLEKAWGRPIVETSRPPVRLAKDHLKNPGSMLSAVYDVDVGILNLQANTRQETVMQKDIALKTKLDALAKAYRDFRKELDERYVF